MAIDYRAFLGRSEELILPWLEGDRVAAPDRSLRLEGRPASPGWWRFRIEGRKATPLAPAEAPTEVRKLPRVSGHLLGRRLVLERAELERLHLMPEEEPPRFAPCRARRWCSGELLFEELPFEGEAEEAVRRAFEDDRGLGELGGVPSTLRAAFGYAVALRAAAALGARVAPLELCGRVLELAVGGRLVAEAIVGALVAERARAVAERERRARLELEAEARAARLQVETEERARTRAMLEARAADRARGRRDRRPTDELRQLAVEDALEGAGARLLDLRRLGGGLLEVRWRFLGQRFVSLVNDALRVVEAGICLSGHDAALALPSLPGVVREAVETGRLVLTSFDEED